MKLEELNLTEGNAEYQKWVSAVKKVSPKYQIIGSMKRAKAICWDKKDSPTIGIWNGTAGEVFPLAESASAISMQDIVTHLEDEFGEFEDVTNTSVPAHYVSYHEHSADLSLTLQGDKLLLRLKNDGIDDPQYSDWKIEFDIAGLTAEKIASAVEDEVDHYFHNLPEED